MLLTILCLGYDPLIQNRVGQVLKGPVPEDALTGKLHLDYVLLSCGGADADIEYGLAIILRWAETFHILKGYILDIPVPQNEVEEGDEYVFGVLTSE